MELKWMKAYLRGFRCRYRGKRQGQVLGFLHYSRHRICKLTLAGLEEDPGSSGGDLAYRGTDEGRGIRLTWGLEVRVGGGAITSTPRSDVVVEEEEEDEVEETRKEGTGSHSTPLSNARRQRRRRRNTGWPDRDEKRPPAAAARLVVQPGAEAWWTEIEAFKGRQEASRKKTNPVVKYSVRYVQLIQ